MWTPEEYPRHADLIAKAFCAGQGVGGNDLRTLVEKTAREHSLLPEQIRRLSRAANTAAFSVKYAEQAKQPDRKVEFDPVDAEEIIRKLQSSGATPVTKVAAAYPDLPNPKARHFEKQAEWSPPAPKPVPPSVRWSHLRKLARELPIEAEQLDIRWQSITRTVAEDCTRIGHRHDAFEKNALAVLGPDVIAELNQIREALKMPAFPYDAEKIATIEDKLIGTPTRHTTLLGEAMAVRTAYAAKHAAVKLAREEFAKIDQEMRRVG